MYRSNVAPSVCPRPESSVAVNIHAETVYGARHGLETLSQLVARVGVAGRGRNAPRKHVLVIAGNVRLSDGPVFRHRGLMLDTARNFLPLYAMKRTLDAMAASKLNVLHWHATDSQSFPLESPRVPQLARWAQSHLYASQSHCSHKARHSYSRRHQTDRTCFDCMELGKQRVRLNCWLRSLV